MTSVVAMARNMPDTSPDLRHNPPPHTHKHTGSHHSPRNCIILSSSEHYPRDRTYLATPCPHPHHCFATTLAH